MDTGASRFILGCLHVPFPGCPMKSRFFLSLSQALLLLGLVLLPGGCGSSGGGGRPPAAPAGDPEFQPGGTDPSETFAGCREALPLDGGVLLSWEPVTEVVVKGKIKTRVPRKGIEYWVYLSTLPFQFEESRPYAKVKDQTNLEIRGLKNGLVYWVTVRAGDSSGFLDKDRVALSFVPAPVRYVRPGNQAPSRDGSTPEKAFASVREALPRVPLPCTLFVGEGTIPGGLLLPGGVALAGGFDSSLDPAKRNPAEHVTKIEGGPSSGPLLGVRGPAHTLVTGVMLNGENRVALGFQAGPGRIALRNVSVVGCSGTGISLAGRAATESRVEGDLSFLRILGNNGAGVAVSGLTGLRFQECLIRRNGNEGLLARGLEVNPEGRLLFSLEGCRVEANRAGGVEMGLVRGPAGPAGAGPGKSLARLRRCLVRDNMQEGVRAVADLGVDPPVEGAVQILFSSFIDNGGSGILVQSSPQAMFLVSGNRVSANRGVAGITVGSGTGGIVRVSNNAVFGNTHDGIRVNAGLEPRLVMVHNNDSAANGGMGLLVEGEDTASLSNTLVWNRRDAQAPWLAYSLRGSGTGGPGVFSGNPGYRVFPVGFQFLDGPGSKDLVHVPWPGVTAPGEFVEIGDDGVARAVEEVTRTGIRFSPPLDAPAPLGSALFVDLDKKNVQEDLRVGSSSPVRGKGSPYLRDPRGGKATVGFLGGPLAVTQVGPDGGGPETDLSFQDVEFLPPPGTKAFFVDRVTVIAGRELDETSVNSSTVRLFNASKMAALPTRVNVFGKGKDRFVVAGFPPAKYPLLLVLTRGIRDAEGRPLSLPLFVFYPK